MADWQVQLDHANNMRRKMETELMSANVSNSSFKHGRLSIRQPSTTKSVNYKRSKRRVGGRLLTVLD